MINKCLQPSLTGGVESNDLNLRTYLMENNLNMQIKVGENQTQWLKLRKKGEILWKMTKIKKEN